MKEKYQPELKVFLYVLLRDHVTFGALEGIMESHVKKARDKDLIFESGQMEEYIQNLIERLVR